MDKQVGRNHHRTASDKVLVWPVEMHGYELVQNERKDITFSTVPYNSEYFKTAQSINMNQFK